jgi:poly(ADP-ribose) glycohydrolase
MIAIDAIKYHQANVQFRMREIDRELHKAYVGFLTGDNLPISTGHWGGGDFNGDKKLKAVIQMLAAGMAGKNLHYCIFGDDAGIERLAAALAGRNVRDVYNRLEAGITTINYTQFDHKTPSGRALIEQFFLDLWPGPS